MLYPKITNIHKSNLVIHILSTVSVGIVLISLLLNYLISTKIHWAYIVVIGIVYAWITTSYSIKKNKNIGSHVVLQLWIVSIATIGLDFAIGYRGWSINYAVPIAIIIANVCLFVLAIITYRKYTRYMVYQLMVFFFSLFPLILLLTGIITKPIIAIIAIAIGVANFVFTCVLCKKEIRQEMKGRFHL